MVITEGSYKLLESSIDVLKHQYQQAKPFPHISLKEVIEHNFLKECEFSFPNPKDGIWWRYDNILERKLARNDINHFPLALKYLIQELQTNRFMSILEAITGISGLIVDHTLNGGGLHQILKGGKLDIHADYNFHPVTKLDRRINLLLYLNSEWSESWKGNLELWDPQMKDCVASYTPIFNRMVIFNVTDQAYHGHPDALNCPADISRKSIALYFYTHGRPASEVSEPHSTIFKRRPLDPIDLEAERLRKTRAKKRIP